MQIQEVNSLTLADLATLAKKTQQNKTHQTNMVNNEASKRLPLPV